MALTAPRAPGAPNHFEIARRRAEQRSNASAQTSQDALKRRFAAMGALNTGAAVKQQQLAREQADQQREEAVQAVDAAESQDLAQKQEAQMGRDFQAGEAEKQRGFQSKQADIDRGFQEKVFQFDKESKLRQLDQVDRQLKLAEEESDFNKRMSRYQASKSGGLFGGGGFMGLGFNRSKTDF